MSRMPPVLSAFRPLPAVVLTTLALSAGSAVAQAPGTIDSSFGDAGKKVIDVPIGGNPRSNICFDIAVQPDGRILLSGSASLIGAASGPERMAAARLMPNGALDGSFGDGGIVRVNAGGASTQYYDGRVEFAPGGGAFLFHGTDASPVGWALARLTANGSLDTGFHGDGILTAAQADLGAGDVGVQPDGKPLVLDDYLAANQDMSISRRLTNGAADPGFGVGGWRAVGFDIGSLKHDVARVVLVQPDGKILIAGRAEASASNADFAVARLTATGALDPTFSGDGKVTLSFDLPIGNWDEARALAVDDRGRIYVGGVAGSNGGSSSPNEAAIARLLPDGSLDPSFSGDGKLTFSFNAPTVANSYDQIFGLALQGDGRIVAAGRATNAAGGGRWFGAARIRENGTLDPTFAGDGTTAFNTATGSGSISVGRAVALAADGRILVAGGGETAAQDNAFVVVRLHNDYVFADGFDHGSAAAWVVTGP